MDETVPDITFDAHGVCNFCKQHEALEKAYPSNVESKLLLIVKKIKSDGFVCLVGLFVLAY